jgi:uncharacterized lipoprotein YmbA
MKPWWILLMIIGMALTSGCASSPNTRFYVLTPLPATTTDVAGGMAVGVGPLDLPEYLDRPQLVTRTAENELRLAEFERWAESLKYSFTQVLTSNLAVLIPTQRLFVYPWRRAITVDYQVQAQVSRFDRAVDGDSVLVVRWAILAGDSGREWLRQESTYRQTPTGPDAAATVAAMNQTLTDFSREVAAALKGLPTKPDRR